MQQAPDGGLHVVSLTDNSIYRISMCLEPSRVALHRLARS